MTGTGVRATVDSAARSAVNQSSGDGEEARDGDDILIGKPGWLEAVGVDLSDIGDEIEQLQRRGLTVSGVACDDFVGLIGIGNEIKDAAETVQRMTDAGITPAMSTGDNERTARAIVSTPCKR